MSNGWDSVEMSWQPAETILKSGEDIEVIAPPHDGILTVRWSRRASQYAPCWVKSGKDAKKGGLLVPIVPTKWRSISPFGRAG